MSSFVAIDFETADHGRDSACAVGLVKAVGGRVVARKHFLIRPPRRTFVFTYIHGITWSKVAREPTFGEIWPNISAMLEGAEYLAAHNASFDRGVLETCCATARVAAPTLPFRCTVQLARKTWGIYPTKLPDVCARLGIRLQHHQALSDAEACAGIVLASISAATFPGRTGEVPSPRQPAPRMAAAPTPSVSRSKRRPATSSPGATMGGSRTKATARAAKTAPPDGTLVKQRVLAYVKAHPNERSEKIRAALWLARPVWQRAVRELVAERKIAKHGEKRAMTFSPVRS